jgi:hypothetical protein
MKITLALSIAMLSALALCSCSKRQHTVTYEVTPKPNAAALVIHYVDSLSGDEKEARLSANSPAWKQDVRLPAGATAALSISNQTGTIPDVLKATIAVDGAVKATLTGPVGPVFSVRAPVK